jgi:uncharacterized membrane protein YhaH (DUF805 family)
MQTVSCPYCNDAVAPDQDGRCPRCGGVVASASKSGIFSGEAWFTDESERPPDAKRSKTESVNPYEAPASFAQWKANRGIPTRGLAWVLFSFDGRIPRRTYWGASIAVTLAFYAFVFVLAAVFGEDSPATKAGFILGYLLMIWMTFAIAAKRWHDRDKSAWWILISLIPLIGPIWAFIENGCLRGTYGHNDYGPDPT